MSKTDEDLLLGVPMICKSLFVKMLTREEATDKIFEFSQKISALLPTPFMTFEAVTAMLNKDLTNQKDKISRATIYRFLRGKKRPLTDFETLVRLASAMGYDIELSLVPRKGYEDHINKRRKNETFKTAIYSP